MIVLSDNDILHKLAVCDLFDEFLAYMQTPAKSIVILPTCIFKLRTLLRMQPQALARLEKFCVSVTSLVDDQIETAVLDTITATGADAGEAILAAKVATTPGAYLVTGDKRAINALSTLPAGPVRSALAGRILCFEELILGIMQLHSFEAIAPKLIAGSACDGVLRIAFGLGRSEVHAKSCLTSYANELRLGSAYLLTPPPRAA
jgi:hypothetical protein